MRWGRAGRTAAAGALAAGLLALSGPVSAQGLSFGEAAERVLSRNERVLAADAAVSRAQAEQRQAWGRHLPEVSVSGRGTRLNAPIDLDVDAIRRVMLQLHPQVPADAVPAFVMRMQGDGFWGVSLNATVPLFAGGRLLAADRAAGAAVLVARAQRTRARGEVLTEVAQRYFGLQLAAASRETRERTVRTIGEHVERARSLERNGQVARAERLRAEVALAEAEREHLQALRDETVARRALASTLAAEEEVLPTTRLVSIAAVPALAVLLEAAVSANPSLLQLEAELARTRQGVRSAIGEALPTVGLFGSRELYTRDLTALQPSWAVGIAFTVPLVQGGQRIARISAARALEREVELRLERARRDVRLHVERRHADLRDAEMQLQSLQSTRELAAESLRAQQSAFSAGLATSLDVLDAEQALARVELGMSKARYDALVAVAVLLEATGSSERLAQWVAEAAGGQQ